MQRELAVVLASGGMDSCVAIAGANQDYELALLHLKYGQRTEARELQAFQSLVEHFRPSQRLVITMEHLSKIGGSSLTDPAIPVSPADLHRREIPSSYIPFRNANMLAVAVSWAEVLRASVIVVGAVEEDSSGYPDCRKAFYNAYEAVIRAGTRPTTNIRIHTPLIELSKAEIVRRGASLNAPFHLTWSCYHRVDVACGVCDSCGLRLRGFHQAGIEDPISYLQRPVYT